MSALKVILNFPKEIETSVFSRLEEEGFLEVLCISNWEVNKTPQRFESFKKAKIISAWDAIKEGISGNFHGVDLRLLSPELLASLQWSESIVMEMMNRIDSSKNMTYLQRKNLYQYLVCYSVDIVQEIKPDVFYSRDTPHEVFDFVLFTVCKHFGVKVVLFNYTLLPGVSVVVDDYRLPWNVLCKDAEGLVKNRRDDMAVNNYLSSIKGDYKNAVPVYFTQAFEVNEKIKKSLKSKCLRVYSYLRGVFSIYYYAFLLMIFPVTPLVKRKVILTKLKASIQNKLVINDFSQLATYYDQLAHNTVIKKPYVYFPLNYQPELSSSPLGGMFVDQSLAIALIASNLPEGWNLYVKEHPGQFLGDRYYGYVSRDKGFYNKILSIQNVKLVPIAMEQFNLIDNSECVATLTGTTGWQAVVRGKPAIVTGEAWYQNAPSVYKVTNSSECINAFKEILKGEIHNDKDVANYVHKLINQSVDIVFDEEAARFAKVDFSFSDSFNKLYIIIRNALSNSKNVQ